MKKNLIALAALTFVGAASAQTSGSSVTLWGLVDIGVAHYSQGGISKTMMDSSGNASSDLGFRGTEDLGGGMSANFWIEMGLKGPTGATVSTSNLFNRRSTVSLAGSFGEVRLGRDYTPSSWNHVMFDPFLTLGPGAGSNITLGGGPNFASGANFLTAARSNNAIQYLWGFASNASTLIGHDIYAQLMYGFPGNAGGQPSIGWYEGGRLGYANGPLNVALSYAQSHGNPIAGETGLYTTFKESNLGGSYDFGVVKAMAHYGVNNSDVAQTKYTHWGIGGVINAGPGYIPISYNRVKQNDATSDGADQWALGYVYNLSKRTALYATVSHISNKNNSQYTFAGGNGGGAPGLAPSPSSATGAPGFTSSVGGGWGSGNAYIVGIKTSF